MINKLFMISLAILVSACVETIVVDLEAGSESEAGTKTN